MLTVKRSNYSSDELGTEWRMSTISDHSRRWNDRSGADN